MREIEIAVVYLCLIVGSILALTTRLGLDYFHQGALVRGSFYAALSGLVIGSWLEPLLRRTQRASALSTRWLLLLLVSWSAYALVREHLAGWLPRL